MAKASHNHKSKTVTLKTGQLITFEVLRFDSSQNGRPRMQEFQIPWKEGLTVLDGLHYIKENIDPSLSWRSSCRMGVCGSCAMFINSYPRLACNTQVSVLGGTRVNIKPLPNFGIIKDLVPDLANFFENHRRVKPFIIRKDGEVDQPTGEFFQSNDEYVRYVQFAYCIKCGACVAACPTAATDERYLGPQALAAAERYLSDTRDDGFDERVDEIYASTGVWRCHFAGACSEACPKGVDPAFAIQLLKQEIILRHLKMKKIQEPARVAPPITERKENPKIPKPPARTV